jgi:DNA-binding transcriptional LysR family regulator
VVKLGGFRRAAERLHMTQPAVSGRIRQIEAQFAVRLLDRTSHRPPVPTPKGMELYAYAERMLSLQTELQATLSGSSNLSGIVRIGIAETLVHTLLGSFVQRLHQDYPGITPEITVDISPILQTMLLTGELDVALLLGPVTEPRVRNIPLGDYPMAWVASPVLELGNGPLGLATSPAGQCYPTRAAACRMRNSARYSAAPTCRRCASLPAAVWHRSSAWRLTASVSACCRVRSPRPTWRPDGFGY